jgi:cyanophycin synthetase
VAVVTNIGEADHLGQYFIDTPEQMFGVKRSGVDIVLPTGTAVLKADDPLVAEMAPLSAGEVIFFCRQANHPVIVAHRAKGKRVVVVRDGHIWLESDQQTTPLMKIEAVRLSYKGQLGFQIENALAAAAAAWALGLAPELIRSGLDSFGPHGQDDGGCCNIFSFNDATVVIDHCRNVSALEALREAVTKIPARQRTVVYSASGEGREVDMVRQGELLGATFDRVIVYDWLEGEASQAASARAFLRRGITAVKPNVEIVEIAAHAEAVQEALRDAAPNTMIVIQCRPSQVESTVVDVCSSQAALRPLSSMS